MGIIWNANIIQEICSNPKMYTGKDDRFDVNQGMLGDSWLLATMSSLLLHKNLLDKVVPLNQQWVSE